MLRLLSQEFHRSMSRLPRPRGLLSAVFHVLEVHALPSLLDSLATLEVVIVLYLDLWYVSVSLIKIINATELDTYFQ